MPACAVAGCGNYSIKTKNTVRYYGFPKDEDLCKQWMNACQRNNKFNPENSRICSKHFHPSAFLENLKHRLLNYMPKNTRNLKIDAIPTECLRDSKKYLDILQGEQNSKPQKKKKHQIILDEILNEEAGTCKSNDETINEVDIHFVRSPMPCSAEDSEDPSISELNKEVEDLKTANSELRKENHMLKTNNASLEAELNGLKSILSKHFGPGQIKHISAMVRLHKALNECKKRAEQ